VIRRELENRGLPESRERMIDVGTELRAKHGPGALAQLIVDSLASDRNYAIDSIRHPAEVEVLRDCGHPFKLIWVDADLETRFERMKSRGRSGDPGSLEELERLEGRELASENPSAQQLLAVKALADFEVSNDGTLEGLHASIRQVFERSLFFERPSWDEYFMSIARTVSSRSNCVKRKVAAVIVRDRRIISTGYNGTPRGTKNCNEGGCPRCNQLSEGGTKLDECLCSHGEENAIVQAAYHGVQLAGATIYTTFSPCLQCTKLIINSGLSEVVYNTQYPLGDVSLDLLREAGVKVRLL
jgi:dCMP deaminase